MSKYCQKLQYKHASCRPIQQTHVIFSLAQAHTFTKYDKKIAMVLMDFVLVNLFLHCKLYNDSIPSNDRKRRKKITCKKYMENLIDELIEIDWANTARDYERRKEDKFSGRKRSFAYVSDDNIDDNCEKDHYFNEVEVDMVPELLPFPEESGVKQSPLTPRHLRLKGRAEIKTNINFL